MVSLFFLKKIIIVYYLSRRSGLSQDDTSLVYSFFRLYYWPHNKVLLNPSTTQYVKNL